MSHRIYPRLLVALFAALLYAATARAENEGQEDLDRATEAKLSAESPNDLDEVIRLCQSALKSGLDKSNTEFANKLLNGTYVQRAEIICAEIFDRPTPPAQWPQLRKLALSDLDSALAIDADQAEVHYMIARLEALPGGDRKRAVRGIDEAVRLSKDSPAARAKALVIRGNIGADAEKRQADYDEAVKLAPHNVEVIRSRGLYYLLQNKFEPAIADLDAAIVLDPKHAETHEARGVALLLLKKYDEAIESFDKTIELAPNSPMAYTHRARVRAIQGDLPAALADLDRAAKIEPRSLTVLLLKARIHQQAGDAEKALSAVDEALQLQPGLIEGLQLRAMLSAGAGKFDQAIDDLEQLKKAAPDNSELLLQLGMFYAADKKPQKAVDTYADVLANDAKSWLAYRGRADAYLSIGKQAEAIADYEAALKLQPDDTGILNNLAWVLATSPDEKLRDGKRAIELATQASKISQYKQAHILSTLAAGYAESGDFENAIHWSEKAVELGREPIKQQLRKELESYQTHKPWRELQTPDDVAADPAADDAPNTNDKSAGAEAKGDPAGDEDAK
jgi:tetratricopeptide (TPR) repeat protein